MTRKKTKKKAVKKVMQSEPVLEGADIPEPASLASSIKADFESDLVGDKTVEWEITENIEVVAKMNNLANRIWQGQSPDVPLKERMARIHRGCTNQGYGEYLDEVVINGD